MCIGGKVVWTTPTWRRDIWQMGIKAPVKERMPHSEGTENEFTLMRNNPAKPKYSMCNYS